MSILLSKIANKLLAAHNAADTEAYVACFAPAAQVLDDGQTHQGHAEIAAWFISTAKQYATLLTPLAYHEDASGATLTASVAGNYPGSPLNFDYAMAFEGELIARLTITLSNEQ